jgi:hypothetical protein
MTKKRLIIILILAAINSLLVVWLAFNPKVIAPLFGSRNRLPVFVALAFCLIPIYPALSELKKGTPLLEGPILIIGLVIYAWLFISAEFLFHATWVTSALRWGDLLFFVGFLLVVWNRYRRRT